MVERIGIEMKGSISWCFTLFSSVFGANEKILYMTNILVDLRVL